MKAWIWSVKRLLSRAGWMGILGITLIAFSGAFYLSSVIPEQKRLEQLKLESTSLRHRAQVALNNGGIGKANNTETQLAAYYRFFPHSIDKNDWLAKIYSAAEHQKLVLETGEYRFIPDQNKKLSRYQIILPLKGTYPQIRKFANEVLTEVPVAAIDDISFKRDTIGATTLDARIKLTLYFGAP